MSRRLWDAILSSSSPRFQDWQKILGSVQVPITSPKSFRTNLGPEQGVEVYMLDLERLDFKQRERLKQFVSEKFGIRLRDVEQVLEHDGFPIRAEDVIVSYDLRAFL